MEFNVEEVINVICVILFCLSELLPFIDQFQGNGLLHTCFQIAKKFKSDKEEKHLSKDESTE